MVIQVKLNLSWRQRGRYRFTLSLTSALEGVVVNATPRTLYPRQWSDNHCNNRINNKLLIIINSNKSDNTTHIKLFHFWRTATSVNQIYLQLTMNNIGLRLCYRKPGQEGGKPAGHLVPRTFHFQIGPKIWLKWLTVYVAFRNASKGVGIPP
jgi:hypothetical protein